MIENEVIDIIANASSFDRDGMAIMAKWALLPTTLFMCLAEFLLQKLKLKWVGAVLIAAVFTLHFPIVIFLGFVFGALITDIFEMLV